MQFLAALFLLLPAVLAAPTGEEQVFLGGHTGYSNLLGTPFGGVAKGVEHVVQDAKEKFTEHWFDKGKNFVKQNGLTCEFTCLIDRRTAAYHCYVTQMSSFRALSSLTTVCE